MKLLIRSMLALVLAGCSILHAAPAAAQTASLSWTAPACTNSSGATVACGTLTYNVYQMTQPASGACTTAAMTAVQTGVTGLAATITSGLTVGSTQCFAIVAVDGTSTGPFSNIATAAIAYPTPGAPGQVTVVIH